MAERLKAAVLKTANAQAFVGSNPTLSASFLGLRRSPARPLGPGCPAARRPGCCGWVALARLSGVEALAGCGFGGGLRRLGFWELVVPAFGRGQVRVLVCAGLMRLVRRWPEGFREGGVLGWGWSFGVCGGFASRKGWVGTRTIDGCSRLCVEHRGFYWSEQRGELAGCG